MVRAEENSRLRVVVVNSKKGGGSGDGKSSRAKVEMWMD